MPRLLWRHPSPCYPSPRSVSIVSLLSPCSIPRPLFSISSLSFSRPPPRFRHPKVAEIPFNSNNKWQMSVHRLPQAEAGGQDKAAQEAKAEARAQEARPEERSRHSSRRGSRHGSLEIDMPLKLAELRK